MSAFNRFLYPLLAVFIILSAAIFISSGLLQQAGFDARILLAANALFFVMNLGIFLLQKKALSNKNPNVFVRTVMAGMMIKMLTCAIIVIVYVSKAGPGYNRKSVFTALFIYLIYLAVEVGTVMKLNRRNNV